VQDRWYADNRDVAKWGVLVHLAQRERLKAIVQVAFLRLAERRALRSTKEGVVPMPDAVWTHFRRVESIEALAPAIGRQVHVVSGKFDHRQRASYLRRTVDALEAIAGPKVVLLDPDTGVAPTFPRANHVTSEEIATVWKALEPSDWLVLYQHASRTKNWVGQAKRKFANACGVKGIETLRGVDFATDVAFLAAHK